MQHVLEALSDEPLSAMSSSSEFFSGATNEHDTHAITSHDLSSHADGRHLYLAQHPLLGKDREGNASKLIHDTPFPPLPPSIKDTDADITSVNLWLCMGTVRSSLHYDDSENLLIVIRGLKTVTLYPPSSTGWLYPRAVSDDGSINHSQIDLSLPEAEISKLYPLYHHAKGQAREVTAREGDGVFIPAGWWHQVDSVDKTIAVNYWWTAASASNASLKAPMNQSDSYYQLRKTFGACQSLMLHQMIKERCREASSLFPGQYTTDLTTSACGSERSNPIKCDRKPMQPPDGPHDLATYAFEIFRNIMTDHKSSSRRCPSTSSAVGDAHAQSQHPEALSHFLFHLSSNDLANLILYTSNNHPHLISSLFSQGQRSKLTPMASYLLTTKLEGLEGQQAACEGQQARVIDPSVLYRSFYSACGIDPEAAFTVLLDGRRRCLEEATRQLMTRVLGLSSQPHETPHT